MINNSSVGQYSNRKHKRTVKSAMESFNEYIIEEMVYQELPAGINALCTIVPKVRLFS